MIKHYVYISHGGYSTAADPKYVAAHPIPITSMQPLTINSLQDNTVYYNATTFGASGGISATGSLAQNTYMTGAQLKATNTNLTGWQPVDMPSSSNLPQSADTVNPAKVSDVSAYCTEITTDGTVNTESEPTKVKIVLANINRMWDDVFVPQKDHFSITVENTDDNSTLHIWHIANGLISDVECDADYCTINGTCWVGDLADALPIHWSKNKQGVKIQEILEDVLALHNPPITVDYQANEVVLEQRTFDAATTFQAVIDYCAEQVHGAVHFVDEDGVFHFWDASIEGRTIDLDYHVTEQNDTESVMGYINIVNVHGDKIDKDPDQPGAENSSMEDAQGQWRDEESIAKYGELIGKDIYLPNIKSDEEAQKRAKEIGEFLKLFRNGLTSPTVVGMAPYLMSHVKYHCKNGPEGKEVFVEGIVTRRKVSYSGESGFTCQIEVSPGALSIASPEELAEIIETIKDDAESNYESLNPEEQ